jgi:hypothetical protein
MRRLLRRANKKAAIAFSYRQLLAIGIHVIRAAGKRSTAARPSTFAKSVTVITGRD